MSDKKFLIKGGNKLSGKVNISGYKNSAGAALAATLLTEETSIIGNLPLVSDVHNQLKILEEIGAEVEWIGDNKVKINPANINPDHIPAEVFRKMRISVLLIGPLLARFNEIKVPHPGGDRIGLRPIWAHIKGLKALGVEVEEKDGFYHFKSPKDIKGRKVILKEFSVSATENLLMLSALGKGETTIKTAAAEPQVQDLCHQLQKMGVSIEGIGNHTLKIKGTDKLKGVEYDIYPDPLVGGTYILAFALTEGKGEVVNVVPEHLTMFLDKLKEIGVDLEIKENSVKINPSKDFKAADVQVLPYPGFPTDLQPQTSVLLTQAEGKSVVHDPLYENRFQHLHELKKLGADIEIADPHRALIFGKTPLVGTEISALDIRSGAALILAGLIAEGQTLIKDISHIDRGYEKIEEKLRNIGAEIKRI